MPVSYFMPHGHCYLWQPSMLLLQVVTNAAIAAAYLLISGNLVYLVRQIRSLPFERIYLAFGLFILSCGVTHVMDIVVIWTPAYWLDVSLRGICGVTSLITALVLVWLTPTVMRVAEDMRLAVEKEARLTSAQATADALQAHLRALTQAKEALERSEQGLRTLTEAIPAIIWTATPDGLPDFFNRRWEEFTGLSSASACQEGWLGVIHPDDRERTLAAWHDSLAQGTLFEMEYRFRRGIDGAYCWFLGRALPQRAASGKVVRWFGICTDVDDQRQVSRALREAQARIDTIIQNAPMVMWSIDCDGRFTMAGGRSLNDVGFKPEDLVGQSVFSLFAQQEDLCALVRRALAGERSCSEVSFRGLWLERHLSPILDAQGKVEGVVGLSIDVSERKRSAAASRDRKRFLAIIEVQQEVAGAALSCERAAALVATRAQELTGADGVCIARCGDEGFTMLGSSGTLPQGDVARTAEALSRTCLQSQQPQRQSSLARTHAADADAGPEGGSFVMVPLRGETQAGGLLKAYAQQPDAFADYDVHTLQLLAGLLVTAMGQAQAFGEKNAIIANLESTQKRLVVARRDAEAAARLKSEFLANMSHEIRTPLNGILGITDLMLEMELGDQQRRYAKIVQDSGRTLLAIINDILDLSKIEANKMTVEQIDFDLAHVVKGRVTLLSGPAEDKGLTLECEMDPALYPILRGDPGRIGQVLLNLLGNSIKFTAHGEIKLRVEVQTEQGSTQVVRFSVQDSGIGIAPADQGRLFNPFTQADGSTARRFGGTGLGLSISKRLVTLMHGEIGVESVENQGSTFWFTLPLARGEAPAPKARTQKYANPTPAQRAFNGRYRVLVADDNDVNLLLTKTMLAALGYGVVGVGDGRECLAALSRESFDLVLMDCQMPHLDGYQTTQALRQEEKRSDKRLPIIALTANALEEDAQKCLACGMDAYLAKPLGRADLAAMLERFLPPS